MTKREEPMRNKSEVEPEGDRPGPITLQMAPPSPSRQGREALLLGGRLLIRTPHGLKPLDQMLIEAGAALPASRVLSAQVVSAMPALALGALRPEAAVTYYHYDLFHVRQAETLAAGHRIQNLTAACLPDLPVEEPRPELILSEFHRDGEVGLACELIRQAHGRLAQSGKMLATINNPHDQWLRRQLEKTFGNLTLLKKENKHGLLYSVKRADRPAGPAGEPARHFVAQVEVRFGEERLTFDTCYGTFNSHGLDEGSRALVEMMSSEPRESILDLGCGWGGLGLLAARKVGARRLTMIDANARAVEMARRNAAKYGPPETEVRLESDVESLQGANGVGSFDAVVTNPPYGTDFRVPDLFISMAWRALKPGGRMWLVAKANEHLPRRVEETFGNIEVLRRRGYSILTAQRANTRRYE